MAELDFTNEKIFSSSDAEVGGYLLCEDSTKIYSFFLVFLRRRLKLKIVHNKMSKFLFYKKKRL